MLLRVGQMFITTALPLPSAGEGLGVECRLVADDEVLTDSAAIAQRLAAAAEQGQEQQQGECVA